MMRPSHTSPSYRTIQLPTAGVAFERLGRGSPVLLLHSINAAASRAEMRKLALELSSTNEVWLVDLPGFGESEKSAVVFDISLFAQTVSELVAHIHSEASGQQVDVIALSLAGEFAARAIIWRQFPARTLTLISPTGTKTSLDGPKPNQAEGFRTRFALAFERSWAARLLYGALTHPASIRFFLRRAFGSNAVDPDLIESSITASRRPGAERAPLAFVTGRLFSPDAAFLYRSLKTPLLIVYGTRGSFGNPHIPADIADNVAVEIAKLDTGALPQVEQPQVVADVWRRFSVSSRPIASIPTYLATITEDVHS
jgi:pimeloyl-ACP methyl ester carboxylesterase